MLEIRISLLYLRFNSGVEQLVARRAHNPKVVGSSPSPATTHSEQGFGMKVKIRRRRFNKSFELNKVFILVVGGEWLTGVIK